MPKKQGANGRGGRAKRAAATVQSCRARPDSTLTARMRDRGYFLCSEVAERVGVHRATVYRWRRRGSVESVSHNGAYYIKWDSVIAFMGEVGDIAGIGDAQVVQAAQ